MITQTTLSQDPQAELFLMQYSPLIDRLQTLLKTREIEFLNLYRKHYIYDNPSIENLIYYSGKLGKPFVRDLYMRFNLQQNFTGPLTDGEVSQWEKDYDEYYRNGGTGYMQKSNSNDNSKYFETGLNLLGYALNFFGKKNTPAPLPASMQPPKISITMLATAFIIFLFIIVAFK